MKRIVRTRIRVISDIAKEKEDLAHPCPDIFTRERHDRDNRPPSLLPCPFLKAELKSFSTGVQRPPIPPPSGKEREKKGERKPRTVVNATRWPPPRLSVNTDANRRPAAAEILLGFLPARATLPPSAPTYDVMHRDPSRPCAIFSPSDHVFYLRFAREKDIGGRIGEGRTKLD